jgi:hypothetical protein
MKRFSFQPGFKKPVKKAPSLVPLPISPVKINIYTKCNTIVDTLNYLLTLFGDAEQNKSIIQKLCVIATYQVTQINEPNHNECMTMALICNCLNNMNDEYLDFVDNCPKMFHDKIKIYIQNNEYLDNGFVTMKINEHLCGLYK